MKCKKYIFAAGIIYCMLGSMAQAQPSSSQTLTRRLHQEIRAQQAKVQLMLTWEKEIRMRDLMSRPPRMGAGNPVISVENKNTVCQGVLLEGNRRVVFPAVCFENDDFLIKKMQISLRNGRRISVAAEQFYTKGDMGYIPLDAQAAQGLQGAAVRVLRRGESLQSSFGSSMTQALHQFFTSHGIAFKTRVCHLGGNGCRRSLQVGEPVFFEGKLVALVKEVPHRYGTVWGTVSEEALAVFRS